MLYKIALLNNFLDINECKIQDICAPTEVCFNQLGDYSCLRKLCPKRYRLDHLKYVLLMLYKMKTKKL